MEANWIIDILGWVGAVFSLTGYFLISTGQLEGTSIKFQALNIVGAIALMLNSYYYGAFPSALVNVVWIAIALLSLYKYSPQLTK